MRERERLRLDGPRVRAGYWRWNWMDGNGSSFGVRRIVDRVM